jgi:hypothetical protein
MGGSERDDEDEFPPRRPFGVPARPAQREGDEDDEGGAPRRPAAPGSGVPRGQPPATRS